MTKKTERKQVSMLLNLQTVIFVVDLRGYITFYNLKSLQSCKGAKSIRSLIQNLILLLLVILAVCHRLPPRQVCPWFILWNCSIGYPGDLVPESLGKSKHRLLIHIYK